MEKVNALVKQKAAENGGYYAGVWPSTGFLAIAVGLSVAQHISASVSVYGYGACSACNKYDDCDGSNSSDIGSINEERLGLNGCESGPCN